MKSEMGQRHRGTEEQSEFLTTKITKVAASGWLNSE
jgi:hypothetical protein